MATSYVEQAILRTKDESTTQINRINRALKDLFTTAKQGRNIRINLSGLQQGTREAQAMRDALNQATRNRSVRITGIAAARQQANQLNNSITAATRNRTVNVRTNQTGGTTRPSTNTPAVTNQQATPRSIGPNVPMWDSMFRNSAQRFATEIEQAIIQGFIRGASQADISEQRLDLLGLTDQERATVADATNEVAAGGVFSRGEAQGLAAELVPLVRGNLAAIATLGDQASTFAELQIAQGVSREEAVDNATLLIKAAEQSGQITDETGAVDPERAEKFFTTIRQGFAEVGREASPQLLAGLLKSLRTAKFSLSDEGLLTSILLAEEQGTTAGVGINQLIKQLSGERVTKRARANQAELGLVTTREVQVGSDANGPIFETVVNATVDEGLLRENPAQWVRENIIPAMIDAGFDPNDATDVTSFAGTITSDRTATESLVALILRNEELLQGVAQAQNRDLSTAAVDAANADSSLVALAEAEAQFTSVLGEIANSLEVLFIPALNLATAALTSVSDFIAGPDGEGSLGRTAAVAGAGLAVAGAGTLAAGAVTRRAVLGPRRGAGGLLGGGLGAAGAVPVLVTNFPTGFGRLGGGQGAPSTSRGGIAAPGGGVPIGSLTVGTLLATQLFATDFSQEAVDDRVGRLESFAETVFGPAQDALNNLANFTLGETFTEDRKLAVEATIAEGTLPDASFWSRLEGSFANMMRGNLGNSGVLGAMPMNTGTGLTTDTPVAALLPPRTEEAIAAEAAALTPIADSITLLPASLDEATAEAEEAFARSNDNLLSVFDQGAVALKEVGDVLETSSVQAGSNLADGLLGMAPQIGLAIGQAAATAIGEVPVNVRQPQTPRLGRELPATGRTVPF